MANDKVLISRAQSGDEQAFADLMRAYYAFVYAIVIGIVNNPHDAEEVVQDTFLNAYRGLAQYEEQTKFRSWLATIARNRALNWLREQKMDTVSINEVEEHTLQTPNTLDDQLIRDEQRELIRRAMETLSQKDREIAHSYYLDGASYDELTKTHGLSYKAISFRLSRAKQRLAKRLQYLLTGLSIPPATTLKQIYSGGFTAMKIGTVPKITAGAIGIVALIFIGFIGVRQMTTPNVEQRVYLGPEKGEIAPTPNETERLVVQTDTMPDTEIRENQPQITSEEMDPIEDFFAQLDEADVQSAEVEFQQNTDEYVTTDTDAFAEDTEQSAEDVMNAYVEALRSFDIEGMRFLSTGRTKEGLENAAADGSPIFDPDEPLDQLKDQLKDLPVEMREMAEQQMQMIEHQMRSEMFEQQMRSMVLQKFSQTKVVRSEYVGGEFHFELGGPTPEIAEIPGIEVSEVIASNELYKMRKENGVWRVYESETLD